MVSFLDDKSRHLQDITDKSRKGDIDKPVSCLVELLNDSDSFFTTSSCSGRIILFSNKDDVQTEDGSSKRKKKGCEWFHVSHEVVEAEHLVTAIENLSCESVLKFEPFILHVRCVTIEEAKALLATSIQSGFRNSGLSIGKANRITLAVRSNLSLEVPFSPECPLSPQYIKYVVGVANGKMKENLLKIQRFEKNVEVLLKSSAQNNNLIDEALEIGQSCSEAFETNLSGVEATSQVHRLKRPTIVRLCDATGNTDQVLVTVTDHDYGFSHKEAHTVAAEVNFIEDVSDDDGGQYNSDSRNQSIAYEGQPTEGNNTNVVSSSGVIIEGALKSSRKGSQKGSKKRVRNEMTWKRHTKSLNYNKGAVKKMSKTVRARSVQGTCKNCRLKCTERISTEIQMVINRAFWDMGSKERRWEFIIRNTFRMGTKRPSASESRRKNTYTFCLPNGHKQEKVCKTFFLKTLDVSDYVVLNAWNHLTMQDESATEVNL